MNKEELHIPSIFLFLQGGDQEVVIIKACVILLCLVCQPVESGFPPLFRFLRTFYYIELFMKVHLIKWRSIEDFFAANTRSKVSFQRFRDIIKHADWETINDIKQTFGTADPIGNDRIVFNVGGNNYRLICSFWFGPRMVHLYVKWIGTHAAYTKLCRENLQYAIDLFN